jgi:UDP-N-acetylmuramyl pentapeptide phosphotransferase/UDP-N-acetylglucosamine-1-phosphate transferase
MGELVQGYSAALIMTVAGLAAFATTHLFGRLMGLSDFLLDKPNERSSHEAPTPRSGGVAIIGGWIIGLVVILGFAGFPEFASSAFLFVPFVVAAFLFGLADDWINLNAALKFLAQFALAFLFTSFFGSIESAPVPFVGDVLLGAWAQPIAMLWIVGFMNAFNFMDGVNGIAVSAGGLALAAFAVAGAFGGAPFWAILSGLAAVCLFSFLPLNFPRARLFMGDNGSQAIGFLIAAAAVGGAKESDGAVNALFLPVVMLPFVFDVAFTLVHRGARRRNVLKAHREHLYQLLNRLGLAHSGVTAIYACLIAVSSAVAFLMLRMPPAFLWLGPLTLAALFLGPALVVFQSARTLDLLEAPARAQSPAPAPAETSAHSPPSRAQAAE